MTRVSPGDAFSDDARDGRGIYRPRGEGTITPAPGNGFLSQDRGWGGGQRIGVLRVTRVSREWKIPQAHGTRATSKAFRSFRRAENAFCERSWAPLYIERYARDARGPSGKTLWSCSFPSLASREEFTVPRIGWRRIRHCGLSEGRKSRLGLDARRAT